MAVDTKVVIAGVVILAVLAIIAIIGVACCACILCAVVPNAGNWGNWSGYAQEHRTDTTVHAGAANIELYVDTISGNIDVVESSTASDVTVTYDVFAPAGYLGDVQTGTRGDNIGNDTVRITATARLNSGVSATSSRGADVTVTVPKDASYTLDLHTNAGNVRVAPLHGASVRMSTLAGNLNLDDGRYDRVSMDTQAGNINAVYGATNASFTTSAGNVVIDTAQTAGTLYANTFLGNVDVTLPPGTLFTLDASTALGNVRHGSIHMAPTTDAYSQLVGPTGGGAGNLTVTLHTAAGNVNIDY